MSVNKPAPRPVNPNKSIKHAVSERDSVILNKFHLYPWRRCSNIFVVSSLPPRLGELHRLHHVKQINE